MAYTKRDSKDPMPTAKNSDRQIGGNLPAVGEKHDQGLGSKIGADANRTTGAEANAVKQPDRQIGGNLPATGESHDQAKGSTIPESRRW